MRRATSLCLLLVLTAAVVPLRAVAEEPLSPEERAKRIAEAKRKVEADERDFAKRVNAAIDKGADWLARQQLEKGELKGTWPVYRKPNDPQNLGRQALVIYTLAKCGASPKDKRIKAALGGLATWFDKIENPGWGLKTYSAAVTILMHDALYNPPPKPKKKDDRYAAPKVKRCKYPKAVKKQIQELLDWLVSKQEANVWRYPGGSGGKEDLSHTQLVLLAFQAAGRCGLEVEPSVYLKVLDYLLREQQQDGPEEILWHENPAYEPGVEDRYGPFLPGPKTKARGFAYMPGDPATGSMTTAGVACLAIIKERLAAQDALEKAVERKIDSAMLCGIAWLSKKWSVTENPGWAGSWHYYYLYGLERVGAMLSWRYIGKHDWYREGAEELLEDQEPSGRWPPSSADATADLEDEILQTCFALLFLRRATVGPAKPVGPAITGD